MVSFSAQIGNKYIAVLVCTSVSLMESAQPAKVVIEDVLTVRINLAIVFAMIIFLMSRIDRFIIYKNYLDVSAAPSFRNHHFLTPYYSKYSAGCLSRDSHACHGATTREMKQHRNMQGKMVDYATVIALTMWWDSVTARASSSPTKIIVHCFNGRSRSPAVIMVFFLLFRGLRAVVGRASVS